MSGKTFKRCTKCGKRVEARAKRCECGGAFSWAFLADVGRHADGKRKQRRGGGFASKAEAERELRELLTSIDASSYIEPSRLTVADYLTGEWLPAIAATVKPTTLSQYGQMVRVHIVPRIGGVALQALTAPLVNAMYANLLTSGKKDGTGLAPKSVRHVHVTLRKALGDAVRWGRTPRNVAELVDPPRLVHAPMKVWTPEELRSFLATVATDRLYAGWLLLATTGMRRGELLGLEWDDVDLEAGRVSVNRSVTVVNGAPVVSGPKTSKGRRRLALDPRTLAALKVHRQTQVAERLALGAAWVDTGLLFCREDGTAIHPERVSDWFRQHAKAARLPHIGIHGTRHSYATAALSSGVSIKIVSERLGHASVSMTLDVYSHVLPGHDEDAAMRVADVILGAVT